MTDDMTSRLPAAPSSLPAIPATTSHSKKQEDNDLAELEAWANA